ncbi:serine/threonine-protein kinase Nek1-like isoform X2 [Asterias rubens]|uniref:serine/threonine-protein kinase Nek1-like isoform X1 n=1 Tax=Asterias rubens TaxID=7604 RepID=UPI00145572F5|nr:serine/threonine-protein kinase Nek1-like isoform X1 [Asterias rubens]XP_033631628.1 serine/threonine-protein kinase Nek1-like isoform X2 [Asterias rubens]
MDKYTKKKKIGEGSFGKALLVVSKTDGKEYVIKEINISKMKRKEKEESKKEVAVLRKMKHPNIVSYQDSFEELGNLYIVMDFCDGGDLYKAINGRRGVLFPEDQVLDWFVQICLAIKHVHDRKILHRDIKSQNIFLTRKGIVKLGDFGIARVLNSTVELARTCIGTPYYLSPEICENKPYNNKSDIWALGCVLYEICTLKHAFEAGNMKNLVLKIIRGSYPPVSPRYSYDLRNLLAQLFKRSARDRPSVNTILKKPYIQRRIEKFLSDTQMSDEFSHTILHRNKAPGPYGAAGRPAFAAERKVPQPVRLSDPSAKYGPSVGVRKPPPAVRKPAEKRKELIQKEKQPRVNQQKQLVDKQRMQHINKAREAGWRVTLSSGSGGSNGIENDSQSNGEPPNKEPKIDPNRAKPEVKPFKPLQDRGNYDNYHNYLDKLRANMQGAPEGQGGAALYRQGEKAWPDEQAARRNIKERPVSASAAEAARRGEMARNAGAEAADRARLVQDFLSNKRAAAAYKARAGNPIGAAVPAPAYNRPSPAVAQFGGDKPGRNHQEEEYLDRLKAIRMQNYQERRNLQQQVAAGGKAVKASLDRDAQSEHRRKKIEALKAQADEKAARLKEQLERQRREAYEKEKRSWEDHINKKRAQDVKRPVAMQVRGPAAAVIPLTAVLKDVGVDMLPKESAELKEEAISKPAIPDEEQGGDRKKWGGGGKLQLGNLPLQETASGMEATGAGDIVTVNTNVPPRGGGGGGGGFGGAGKPGAFGPPPPLPQGRKKWGGAAQTALNVLQQAEVVQGTTTLATTESGGKALGITIVKDGPSPHKLPIVKGTITIPEATKTGGDSVDAGDIETIDAEVKEAQPEGEPDVPKTRSAWDKSNRSASASPGTASSPKEDAEQTLKAPSSPLKPTSPSKPSEITQSPRKSPRPDEKQSSPVKTKEFSPRKSPSSSSLEKDADETKTKDSSASKEKQCEDQPSSPVTQTGSATHVVNRFSTPTKQSGSPATGSLTLSTLSAIQTQIPKKSSYLGSEDGSNTTKTQEGARDMSRAISTEPNLRKTPLSPQQNNLKAPIPFDDQLDSPDDILILDDPTGSPVQPVSSPCNSKLNPDAPIFEPMSPVDAWGTLKQETKIAAGALVSQVELDSDEDNEEDQPQYDDEAADRSEVIEGLETGNFDTDARILRTCSLPDLSKLFRTTLALNPFYEVEKQTMEIAARTLELELADLQVQDVDDDDEEEEDDSNEGCDDVDGNDAGDEADVDDDDDDEEYKSLVESMKSILEAADAEDNPTIADHKGQGSTGGSDDRSSKSSSPVGAEGGDEEEDDMADGNESGESKPINEDWDSGDGTDGEEEREGDDESLFSRLEESRLQLEKELGCDTFIKAYKSIQAIHEDEDEDIEQGTKVIGSILAEDQEHLYTKILQLVMADGAYTEDND